MKSKANFRVAPRLATLLGEHYRSIEHAIRELVDNAWDADAENVRIDLPQPLTGDPIVVSDDGCGMSDAEVQREYLEIAHDRRSCHGKLTAGKRRRIRGRNGIGKFAGLVVADEMRVETRTRGKRSTVEIEKQALLQARIDLERIDLPLAVEACDPSDHGTVVTLSNLNPRFALPNADTLKELLVLEFGRCADFTITVNEEPLTHEAIKGRTFSETVVLPDAGEVTIRFTIMDCPKGTRRAGIVTRVGGKIVGQPSFFGLESDEELPRKLLNRIVGEIEADGLEEDVTADWGALFENSNGHRALKDWAQQQLKSSVREVFAQEVNLAKARRQKKLNELLARVPEHRRPLAQAALDRTLRRFFSESEEKIDVLISLVLEAFEKDEYWTVCQKVEEARHADVVTFAEALMEFGLVDLACMGQQARRRLKFLDDLDALARNPATLEATMHKALDHNLWVFGAEYSLMSSNRTLAQTIQQYTRKTFSGTRANKRPDLFLAQAITGRYLLIEFKRPAHTLDRDDENQAEQYRDDLTPHFDTMDILLLGGKVSPSLLSQYKRADIKLWTYERCISNARTQLDWLLTHLQSGPSAV